MIEYMKVAIVRTLIDLGAEGAAVTNSDSMVYFLLGLCPPVHQRDHLISDVVS